MALTTGILFGLLSMLGYGVADAVSQIPSRKIGAVRTIFYRGLMLSALLLILVLLSFDSMPFTTADALIMLGIAVLGYFPLRFFLKGIKTGKVGLVSPIAKSSVLTTVILALIIYEENLSLVQFGAITSIVLGIILVSVDLRDLRQSSLFSLSSGIPYALISSVLWGVVYFLLKMPVLVFGPLLTAFFLEFGVTLSAGVHLLVVRRKRFKWPGRDVMPYLIITALAVATGTVGYAFGIQSGKVSVISALSFSSPLIATLYSRIHFKEILRPVHYLGSLFILAGVITVTLS